MVEEKPKITLFIPQHNPNQPIPMNPLMLVPPMIGESKNEYVKMT